MKEKKTHFIGEYMELRSSSLPASLWRLVRVDRRRPALKVSSSAKPSLNFAFLLFTLLVKGRKWWSDDKYGACLERRKPFSCEHKPPCFPGWWKTHFVVDWTCKRSSVFPLASVNTDLLALPEYISNEEDLFKSAKVYATIGKSFNPADKGVLSSLCDHNMWNKCFKDGWCMYLKSLEQLSVAVMMSTTLSHIQLNTWPTAVHKWPLLSPTCVWWATLRWSGPPQVRGHVSRSCRGSKQNRWGRPWSNIVVTKPPCVSRPDGVLPLNMRGKRS